MTYKQYFTENPKDIPIIAAIAGIIILSLGAMVAMYIYFGSPELANPLTMYVCLHAMPAALLDCSIRSCDPRDREPKYKKLLAFGTIGLNIVTWVAFAIQMRGIA